MSSALPRRIAVIDIGKTNAKVVLISSETGEQIAALSQPNSVVQTGPYPHADVDGLWVFILDGLSTLHAQHGVDGISITTHGATAAPVDENDLVLPVLDYESMGRKRPAPLMLQCAPTFQRLYRRCCPTVSIWAHRYSGSRPHSLTPSPVSRTS